MIDVKGKWALITGASRGIGKLSAIFMAEQGCNLILHSRKNTAMLLPPCAEKREQKCIRWKQNFLI